MEKLKILDRIKELYGRGENLIQYLKGLNESNTNSTEDILISYDFQAGVYTKRADINQKVRDVYCKNLANVLQNLEPFDSIIEVGVGEASTLGNLLLQMEKTPENIYGFDLSWSRIKYANKFLNSLELDCQNSIQLCTGDLFNAPFGDNSIDVVYTSHSLEPNGGMEKEALEAVYRITKKYLILLEPAFELADEEAKARMIRNGYVTNLMKSAEELGYNVLKYALFEPTFKPLNPTGLMIIKKGKTEEREVGFACPVTKCKLYKHKDAYYSKDALLAYPILDGVPCLMPQNAIVASHFLDE